MWRLAIAVPVALAVAAGVLVAVRPSRPPVLTAQLLADRAAAAALATPAVSSGAWVYQETEFSRPGAAQAGMPTEHVQAGWMTANGNINYGAGSIGDPIYPYNKLGSLPRNPAKLNAYFRSLDPVKTDNTSSVEFGQIKAMLFGMVLPPWLKAEMFHALALIPIVQVKDHVKDITGRAGVAFVLPPTRNNLQLEIILDASTYQLLAEGSWGNPSQPSTAAEQAILKEYLVTELGSTQPSTSSPTATELAAERIDYYQEHLINPPKINSVTPGQWLYRDLRVNGKDIPIWATADDSAQARYVNGALRVCQRTDPCAASEQWLMPTGPSYRLIYPSYPQPTQAQMKKYLQDLKDHIKATSPYKLLKEPPSLPQYPQPLLTKLNTYKTGCGAAATDCNAVNVAANVLTGYGNYPSLSAVWFYALADVPGVSVKHITNAAGQQDIAFTFPARDGVTAILVNARQLDAGTVQYDGYVRDGQQTLVLDQALVSGPGVRP
ncbi:MAG TPA: hypothetical protein VGH27_27120 [Streptosporangiaceae bacterium]